MRGFSVGVGRFCGTCLLTALAIVASPMAAAADLVQLKGGEVITSSDLSQYLERRVDLRAS